jgi:hypothetical protein
MMQLEARWSGTDNFVDVEYAANLDEAKTLAIQFQHDHHVHAAIEWSPGELSTQYKWYGYNKYITFRLREP